MGSCRPTEKESLVSVMGLVRKHSPKPSPYPCIRVVPCDVEEGGPDTALVLLGQADEVLLRVTSALGWCARRHVLLANVLPVALQNGG